MFDFLTELSATSLAEKKDAFHAYVKENSDKTPSVLAALALQALQGLPCSVRGQWQLVIFEYLTETELSQTKEA